MAGVKGFEPLHDGVRVHSLTAWRHPHIKVNIFQKNLAPRVGLEPTTDRLTADCSTD